MVIYRFFAIFAEKNAMIDTHSHIDETDFAEDINLVISRAKEAGITAVLVPGIHETSVDTVRSLCNRYPGFCYGMAGLHPEEVRNDFKDTIERIKEKADGIIAVGEIGLDYYWSREFEKEQLEAFELQLQWAVEAGLPVDIHCRKAQNEMIPVLKKYERDLVGGVFHCFTGNVNEARQLLQFQHFVLGIGGVLTFKRATLPETLREAVPIERIVIETDAPYMAPVPHRGKRNEPSYVANVLEKIAEIYGIGIEEADRITTETAKRIFNI